MATERKTAVRPPSGTATGNDLDAQKYPNMTAMRELEHAQHVKRGLDMGLTRKEAEKHAREDEHEGEAGERKGKRTAPTPKGRT